MTKNYLNIQNPNKAANFIKSALYKWFQLFERPITTERIQLQMDLLANDVSIITSLGSIKGKSNFPNQMSIFNNWTLANHIAEIDIYPVGVRMYSALTKSDYHVIHPDGNVKNYTVQFEADLKLNDDLNCEFHRIVIKSVANANDKFKDNYALHRASDVVCYCMGMIEKNVIDSSLFENCFESDFEIQPLKNTSINSLSSILVWIEELNKTWANLSLNPVNISVHTSPDDEIEVKFDLLMEGVDMNGKSVSSLSKNQWLLSNDINEAFARVKLIRVEKLEPIFI